MLHYLSGSKIMEGEKLNRAVKIEANVISPLLSLKGAE